VNVVKKVTLEFLVFQDRPVHVVLQVKAPVGELASRVHLDSRDLLDHP
jgi:hypothetical protein